MKITGHKTLSVYQRYRSVSASDIRDALERTQVALSASKQTRKIESMPAPKEVSR